MSKIYENLFLGNLKISQNIIFFEKNKIENVLIVAQGLKRHFKQKNYFQINAIDNADELIIKYWPSCIQFLEQVNGNTLVHCLGGVSRSASTVMAYAMFKENLSSEKGIKKISKLHHDSNPNSGFLKQLEFWDEILFSYRQQIAFGQKENFDLLQSITSKFMEIQEKRIAYHLRICMENKKARRSKKMLIEESIENNPIDSVNGLKGTKQGYIQRQKEYENQIDLDDLEDNHNHNQKEEEVEEDDYEDDYEYIYENKENKQSNLNQNLNHNDLNQEKQDNEKYEFCYKDEDISFQIKKTEQTFKEKARQEIKFNKMMDQLETEKNNQEKLEKTESSSSTNEEWFYSNVKLVNKKKHKKQTAEIF